MCEDALKARDATILQQKLTIEEAADIIQGVVSVLGISDGIVCIAYLPVSKNWRIFLETLTSIKINVTKERYREIEVN